MVLSTRCQKAMLTVMLAIGIGFLGMSAWGLTNFDKLAATLTQRWGDASLVKFKIWRTMLANTSDLNDLDRLKRTNDFFNRQLRFAEDAEIWGQPDYWATPMESLGKGSGDCEDFAIAKYFTLRESQVEPAKLRLVYVRASTGSATSTTTSQAHMVLAYYAQPDAEPLILDNLVNDIRPASRRPDLVPVFSFNSEGVFSSDTLMRVGNGRLSRWEDLLKRARIEGFDLMSN
jgi:predicted transglutaminase-like cysteine proteinase